MDGSIQDRGDDRANALLSIYLVSLILVQFFVLNQAALSGLFSQTVGARETSIEVDLHRTTDVAKAETIGANAPEPAAANDDIPLDEEGLAPKVAEEPADMSAQRGQQSPLPPESARIGLSGVQFDLRNLNGGTEAPPKIAGDLTEIKKPLYAGGNALGSLAISVDGHAQVFVKKSALAGLLAGESSVSSKLARLPDGEMVSFRSLRDYGINLKYEPVSDRILLDAR